MTGRIPEVVVMGPAYVDMAVRCQDFPAPGQWVEGASFSYSSAGAGVNRAIQAALCGCKVHLFSRVGDDCFGAMIKKNLEQYQINTEFVYTAAAMSTGVLVTLVDAQGDNIGCLCPGANRTLRPQEIEYAAAEQTVGAADVCLICSDMPQAAIVSVLRLAAIHKKKTILDVCLKQRDRQEIASLKWPMEFYNVDILVVRFEDFVGASELGAGGQTELKYIGADLVARGAACVVVSLGWRGAMLVDRQGILHISGVEKEVVDNNCAMDAFCGALAASFGTRDTARAAVGFAVAAEALARSRFGLQDTLPRKEEIIALLQQLPD